jgi:diacylglycerol kinase family enzyme
MFLAALTVLRRYPLVNAVLDTPAGIFPRITPFVFVGNNRYAIHLLALGARDRLDEGQLCVYFANRTGRFGLLRLMLRASIGRLNQAKDFDSLSATHLRIDSLRRAIPVAIDGEVHLLHPPLNFTIRPRSLRVFAP